MRRRRGSGVRTVDEGGGRKWSQDGGGEVVKFGQRIRKR
jgi:hypothetical protein